jgi:hypothetical protein
MTAYEIDKILELQLAVAWAGETTEPPRLAWWKTAMADEYGGEDLLRRLTPKTWQWAALECCRAAAKRLDEAARSAADDPDNLISLYRFGFEVDERLDDRLLEHKQSGQQLKDIFPELAELLSGWAPERFEAWLQKYGSQTYTTTATGRRLGTDLPKDFPRAAAQLTAALQPIADKYPLPYFRVSR